MLLDLIAVVLDQIRGLFDVADAFEPVLPGLVAHERRKLPASRADAVCDFFQQGDALGPRQGAPGRIGRSGGRDGVARLLAARALKCAEQHPRIDRTPIVELARGANLASAEV